MHYMAEKREGKRKRKRKGCGRRSIFRRGQGARLRPATPSPSACPAEESQEETSVASTPGTADVMADEFKEEEMDPGVPWNHGAKAPPVALQPRWYGPPPGPPQGPSPQGLQQGPLGPQHGPHKAYKAYNMGYNMDTKEKDFKMLAARHQKPLHKPFRLLQIMSLKGATWLSQQAKGESDEVPPRPTIFTAAFGTVYHVRPSCGKLRCASRIFRHEAFTPCPCGVFAAWCMGWSTSWTTSTTL